MKPLKEELKKYERIERELFESRGKFNSKFTQLFRLDKVRKDNIAKFSLLKDDRTKLDITYKERFDSELEDLVEYLVDEDPYMLNHSEQKKKIISNAIRISLEHHKDRLRKDRKFLYITHPYQVARYGAKHKFGLDMVIGGIIHDISEEFFKRITKIPKAHRREIHMKDVMEHSREYLLKGVTKTKALEKLVDDCVDMASHMSKPVEEPWHKYLGRVMNEQIELTSKTITLKYLDLVYNILDFDEPHDYGKLKPSTRLAFVVKNLLIENELRKLERDEGLKLGWKKEELDKLRDANLYYSIRECDNNINFLRKKLNKNYVKKTRKQLKRYEETGNFDRKTRKPTERELEYAPWKKFDGVLTTLFSYWRGDFNIKKLNREHKTMFDYFSSIRRGLELMYLDKDRVIGNIVLYNELEEKK